MILVTGSAGFIGKSVCAVLGRAGRPFLGIDLPECDITDANAVAALFRHHAIDAVIHLAAILPSAARANPSLATRVNIFGSANLLAAAGSARFVFGSSMSVYGVAGSGAPVSEDCPPQPGDLYGAAKRYIEIYGETAPGFTSLRIATVVGPGVGRTASPWRGQLFDGPEPVAIPYPADALLSLVHVEDVAAMLVLLATRKHIPARVYNTPAENLRAAELGRIARIELDPNSRKLAPPAANGSRFRRDFGYELLAGKSAGAAHSAKPGD